MIVDAADVILESVNAVYPGGIDQFSQDGGSIRILPNKGKLYQIWIFHPSITDKLRGELEVIAKNMQSISPFELKLTEQPAFECAPEELLRRVYQAMLPLIESGVRPGPDVSPTMFTLTLFDHKKGNKVTKDLIEVLKNVEGLNRFAVICKDGTLFEEAEDTSASSVQAQHEVPEREKPIDKGDIVDLRIALETNPWELFEREKKDD